MPQSFYQQSYVLRALTAEERAELERRAPATLQDAIATALDIIIKKK